MATPADASWAPTPGVNGEDDDDVDDGDDEPVDDEEEEDDVEVEVDEDAEDEAEANELDLRSSSRPAAALTSSPPDLYCNLPNRAPAPPKKKLPN